MNKTNTFYAVELTKEGVYTITPCKLGDIFDDLDLKIALSKDNIYPTFEEALTALNEIFKKGEEKMIDDYEKMHSFE